MTMSGLNNSLYVDQMIEEARPSARDMKMAEAREAFWAARRRDGPRGPRRGSLGELRISAKAILLAAIVILALIFSP